MIEQIKDPIVTELERIVKDELAIPCTFVYANLRKANFDLDLVDAVKFPALVYVATQEADNTINIASNIIREARVSVMLLDRKPELPTLETESKEVDDVIYRMYQLAQNLVFCINRSPFSGASQDGSPCGVNSFKDQSIYSWGDANLFGKGVDFTWRINTGASGYQKKFGSN